MVDINKLIRYEQHPILVPGETVKPPYPQKGSQNLRRP